MTPENDERRDSAAGREAGRRWAESAAVQQLSEEQFRALGENLGGLFNDKGDLVHQDENADPAADAYAAPTGDWDCRSRATVRAFWARILPGDLDDYGEEFFTGFLTGAASEVS
jgi:hypothetical protein